MKTAAIVIDRYKKNIFTRRLEEAGIPYELKAGPTKSTYTIKIKGETVAELLGWRGLITKINAEATR